PLGLYAHETSEAALQTAADLHLNLVLMGPDHDYKSVIQAAHDKGLQVILESGVPREDHAFDAAQKLVHQYGALAPSGWSPVDEPGSRDQVDPLYANLAAADGRPVFQSNHSPASFAELGPFCDILAVDPYPVSAVPRPLL